MLALMVTLHPKKIAGHIIDFVFVGYICRSTFLSVKLFQFFKRELLLGSQDNTTLRNADVRHLKFSESFRQRGTRLLQLASTETL
jgi:hypothetical protein